MGLFNGCLLTLTCLVVAVSFVGAKPSWYDDQNRGNYGWYGYEPEKPAGQEDQGPEEDMNQGQQPAVAGPASIGKWPSYQEAMGLRPEELGKYLKEAGAEAFRNPEDEEMMLRWAQYMAVTRVKSSQFAQANAYTMLRHPELAYQEATDVIPGLQAMVSQKWRTQSDYLKGKAEHFGLLLFTLGDGDLNGVMGDILDGFARYFDWSYRVVDVEENPVLAQVVGVTKIPQIFLIAFNNEFEPALVATGPTTALGLAQTVYRVLKMELEGRSVKDFAEPDPTVIDLQMGE